MLPARWDSEDQKWDQVMMNTNLYFNQYNVITTQSDFNKMWLLKPMKTNRGSRRPSRPNDKTVSVYVLSKLPHTNTSCCLYWLRLMHQIMAKYEGISLSLSVSLPLQTQLFSIHTTSMYICIYFFLSAIHWLVLERTDFDDRMSADGVPCLWAAQL